MKFTGGVFGAHFVRPVHVLQVLLGLGEEVRLGAFGFLLLLVREFEFLRVVVEDFAEFLWGWGGRIEARRAKPEERSDES